MDHKTDDKDRNEIDEELRQLLEDIDSEDHAEKSAEPSRKKKSDQPEQPVRKKMSDQTEQSARKKTSDQTEQSAQKEMSGRTEAKRKPQVPKRTSSLSAGGKGKASGQRHLSGKTKKKSTLSSMMIAPIALLVLGLTVLFFVIPDKEYSDTEKRSLEQAPKLTWSTLTSGSFEDKAESYIADQFPFRNSFVALKTTCDRLLGKVESNNIILGSDGWFFQNFPDPDMTYYQRNVDAIKNFASEHSDMTTRVLVAPTSLDIYDDYLPAWADIGDEDAYLDQLSSDLAAASVTFIDVRENFRAQASNQQLYYKTDHHWTTAGAHLAYQAYADSAQLTGRDMLYQPMCVSDTFEGTLVSQSGYSAKEPDSVYVYLPAETVIDYTVTWVDDNTKSAFCYKTDALDTSDPYTVFFGGNYGLVEIETAADNGRILLVLKDSYANCFVPFLIPDYSKIFMVDPRYYNEDINSLLATYNFTDILCLYNVNSFSEDAYLHTLLDTQTVVQQES